MRAQLSTPAAAFIVVRRDWATMLQHLRVCSLASGAYFVGTALRSSAKRDQVLINE
jgi:hypothetical protein